ncbi:hypothetical protein ACI784_16840 [Geodermatophilus sp. SYSU D01186]
MSPSRPAAPRPGVRVQRAGAVAVVRPRGGLDAGAPPREVPAG